MQKIKKIMMVWVLALVLIPISNPSVAALATIYNQLVQQFQDLEGHYEKIKQEYKIHKKRIDEAKGLAKKYERILKKLPKQKPENIKDAIKDIKKVIRVVRDVDGLTTYAERRTEANFESSSEMLKAWTDNAHKNVEAVYDIAGMTGEQILQENATIAELEADLDKVEGQQGALEGIAKLLALQIAQTQKTRQILAALSGVQAAKLEVVSKMEGSKEQDVITAKGKMVAIAKWQWERCDAMSQEELDSMVPPCHTGLPPRESVGL